MFFNSVLTYRLTQNIAIDAETLEAALAAKSARPCASQELSTYGFVAPFGKGEDAPLVHASHGFLLIATRKEERILPSSVVRDAVKEKVELIEDEQMRKVYKKERDQIKDEIIQEFLPRAFIRKSGTYAAIDLERGLILVNSNSARKAEDLLSTLREAIGSLPVRPLTVKASPSATMTDWVRTQKAAEDFFVLDEALLRDTHEAGGSITAKRQDMTSEEIQQHVEAGKQVVKLSIGWQDKLSFVLDDKLVISRLRFEELLQDQAEKDGGDDDLGKKDASFVLMMLTFRNFLPALFEAFGGEEIPQGLASPHAGYSADASDVGVFSEGDDPLLAEARHFVRTTRRASTAAIQRRFKIGYNRAARMIENLEAEGLISPMNSHGSRDVIQEQPE